MFKGVYPYDGSVIPGRRQSSRPVLFLNARMLLRS